jgi:hypothetical protein
MLNLEGKRVYLACGATDMRKSINGLSLMVQENFCLDPFGTSLFVFCNKKQDRLKILEWDGDGFWLYFKRLEKGHFRWPSPGEEPVMTHRRGIGCAIDPPIISRCVYLVRPQNCLNPFPNRKLRKLHIHARYFAGCLPRTGERPRRKRRGF